MFSRAKHGFWLLAHICHDRRGSASIFGALILIAMLAMAAFSEQLAMMYVTSLQVQRFADVANMAAAGSSAPVSGSTPSATATATAMNLATINGLGSATVTTTASTPSAGSSTLTTLISLTSTLPFGGLLGHGTVSASASSTATVNAITNSDCVAAFLGAIQITGSATVSAPSCGMGSATDISLSGSTVNVASATTGYDAYDEIPLASGAASLSPAADTFVFNGTTTNTLASNASVTAINSHLASLSSWPYTTTLPIAPIYPSVSAGGANTYTNTTGQMHAATTALHGTVVMTNSTLNMLGGGAADPNCTNPTTVSGDFTLNGNNTLNFASGCFIFAGNIIANAGTDNFSINAGAIVKIVIEKTVSAGSSATLTFGNATYSFGSDITSNSGGTIVVGTGTKAFGGNINQNWGHITFGDGPYYFNGSTIQGATGTTQFGNGPFYLWNAKVDNPNWGTIIFGNGPFYFYNTPVANGVTAAGALTFGSGPFYFYKSNLITNFAGSSTTFGPGNMDFYGGGYISINGNAYFGSGGSATTGGSTVSLAGGYLWVRGGFLSAVGTTFALTTGQALIWAPLYARAPTGASPTYGVQNVLVVANSGNVTFSNSTSHLGGMIYAPSSTVAFSGTADVYPTGSDCLGVAAGYVTISGGASFTGVPCSGVMPTSTGSQVSLSQ